MCIYYICKTVIAKIVQFHWSQYRHGNAFKMTSIQLAIPNSYSQMLLINSHNDETHMLNAAVSYPFLYFIHNEEIITKCMWKADVLFRPVCICYICEITLLVAKIVQFPWSQYRNGNGLKIIYPCIQLAILNSYSSILLIINSHNDETHMLNATISYHFPCFVPNEEIITKYACGKQMCDTHFHHSFIKTRIKTKRGREKMLKYNRRTRNKRAVEEHNIQCGSIAQMVERLIGKQEGISSSPVACFAFFRGLWNPRDSSSSPVACFCFFFSRADNQEWRRD
jgi:hypothetical protein